MKLSLFDRSAMWALRSYQAFRGIRVVQACDSHRKDQADRFMEGCFEKFGLHSDTVNRLPLEPDQESLGNTFVAKKNDRVIGAVETYFGGNRFLLEDLFNVEVPKEFSNGNTIEVSRIAVEPDFRGQDAGIGFSLLERVLCLSAKLEVRYWLACSSGWLLTGFRRYSDWQLLPQLEPTEKQKKYRVGRENYFAPKMDPQVYAVDLEKLNIGQIASQLFRDVKISRKVRRQSAARRR